MGTSCEEKTRYKKRKQQPRHTDYGRTGEEGT